VSFFSVKMVAKPAPFQIDCTQNRAFAAGCPSHGVRAAAVGAASCRDSLAYRSVFKAINVGKKGRANQ